MGTIIAVVSLQKMEGEQHRDAPGPPTPTFAAPPVITAVVVSIVAVIGVVLVIVEGKGS